MTETRDLLFELGTEELPSSELIDLASQLRAAFDAALADARVARADDPPLQLFATPRRLAVRVHGVATAQSAQTVEHRGPPVQAAFDEGGNATRAAEGFARGHGVTVEDLERRAAGKAEYLFYIEHQSGRKTAELLPGIVRDAVARLRPNKQMRWGVPGVTFPRPVHWAVLLFGEDVIETEVLGVTTGRRTRGHRFHHPAAIELERPTDYEQRLYEPGHVMAGLGERRERIREQVTRAAHEAGGEADLDASLLDEVTSLVEWPVALAGTFDERFLDVPPEALVAVMKDHQKYFPVYDGRGRLLPRFVTVSNIDSEKPEVVRGGNERVIEPRLADAEFFWNQDRRRPLGDRLDGLRAMVFQRRLGSLHDRSMRIAQVARELAAVTGADAAAAARAGELCKCDLLTEMVGEFPELQGIMGGYYARHDGEPDAVAEAIAEHYRPAFAGDDLPATPTGRAVALADRLDVLVGIFAIGQAPKGDRDPFALRRAALGVLRIVVEGRQDLDLRAALATALDAYRTAGAEQTRKQFASTAGDDVLPAVEAFVLERFKAWYAGAGYGAELFEAVRARGPSRPLDFDARIRALSEFRDRPEAVPLAEANKRIRNILRKTDAGEVDPDPGLYTEPAEKELGARVDELAAVVRPLLEQRDYQGALARLADLAKPLADYFDHVLVMDEDPALRANRIALLERARGLFLGVADLSHLHSG
ncbi:MAG: glycine--tRNA ligase subunit beta [Halofilum sp. (in: g-proteobacteria)]|nr:glycine--tRNA ligase subunit beta [Halofilum sp. (in: g-proteobacteria)]